MHVSFSVLAILGVDIIPRGPEGRFGGGEGRFRGGGGGVGEGGGGGVGGTRFGGVWTPVWGGLPGGLEISWRMRVCDIIFML